MYKDCVMSWMSKKKKKKIVSSHSKPPVRGSETITWPHRGPMGKANNENFDYAQNVFQ